jgi:hypothetical protein
MTSFLFVTEEEFEPSQVTKKGNFEWSCTSITKSGDRILVYVKGKGIQYQWEAESDAERSSHYPFMCSVRRIKQFKSPLSMAELKEAFTQKEWPVLYTHFRGMSAFRITDEVFDRITKER